MLKNDVREIYEGLSVNKWGHVKRVLAFATILSKKLGLNTKELRLVQASALVHDIGYKKQFEKGGEDIHEKHSVEMCEDILHKNGFSQEEIEEIREIISTHGVLEDCKTKLQKSI